MCPPCVLGATKQSSAGFQLIDKWQLFVRKRGIDLQEAIDAMVDDPEFAELQKFALNELDWEALGTFRDILKVSEISLHND